MLAALGLTSDVVSSVVSQIGRVKPVIEQALTDLRAAAGRLRAARAKVARLPAPERASWESRLAALTAQHTEMVKAADVANQVTEVGVLHLVVVGGIALGAVACAYLYVRHEEVGALAASTELFARELDARLEAARDGRILAPSTLPAALAQRPSSSLVSVPSGRGMVLVAGGVALLAGAGFVLMRRQKS